MARDQADANGEARNRRRMSRLLDKVASIMDTVVDMEDADVVVAVEATEVEAIAEMASQGVGVAATEVMSKPPLNFGLQKYLGLST